MMIKCSKCGFENQMGAIFCRGCGEKIDMDALDPETIAKSKNDAERGKKIAKIIRHTLGIIILLAIVGTIGAAFVPCGDAYAEAPEAALKTVTRKIEILGGEKLSVTPKTMDFTVDEINALFNQRFMKTEAPADGQKQQADAQAQPAAGSDEKGFYNIEHIQFSIHEGKLHATLHIKLVDKVPMTVLFIGTPKFGDEVAPVGFDISYASWGLFPMNMDFLRKVITEKFASAVDFDELKNLFKRTEAVEVQEDKLVFSFRKNSKAPRTAAKKKTMKKKEKKAKKTENAED